MDPVEIEARQHEARRRNANERHDKAVADWQKAVNDPRASTKAGKAAIARTQKHAKRAKQALDREVGDQMARQTINAAPARKKKRV